MTTLHDLQVKYHKHPVTLATIMTAIAEHGATATSVISRGLPSNNAQSNLVKRARAEGYTTWSYYVGARAGRHANDGNYNIIVKTS